MAVTIDDVLDGPRGRRACWELLNLCSPECTAGLPEQVVVANAVALWRDRFTVEEEAGLLFDSFRASVAWALYWQDPDDVDVMLAGAQARSALQPVADFVATSAAVAWWSTAFEPTRQACVQFIRYAPEPITSPAVTDDGLRQWHAATARANDVMRQNRKTGGEAQWAITSGEWWTPPIFGGVVSSTRVLDRRGPLGLWLTEDAGAEDLARAWPLTTTGVMRVFEIDGPSSWAEVVRRFPLDVTYARGANWLQATGRDGAWLIPDWEAVSTAYDAVHLTVQAYLTTSGRVIPIDDQHASFIAGWGPDEAYWLTDIVTVGEPTDWSDLDGEGAWSPVG